mgnify:CR=1 FL=1
MSAINRQTESARRKQLITSWGEYAPELTLGGMTLTQFVTKTEAPEEIRQRLFVAKTQVAGILLERQQADQVLRDDIQWVVNDLRGTPGYGPDCPFFRSLGFVAKSQRKRPVRIQTVSVPATTAEPQPAPTPANAA